MKSPKKTAANSPNNRLFSPLMMPNGEPLPTGMSASVKLLSPVLSSQNRVDTNPTLDFYQNEDI